MSILYTAVATATAGRDGKVFSDDHQLEMGLSVPKGMGGPGGTGTNPEQLFAAGYAACFGSALGLIARQQKVATGTVAITAKVSLEKGDKGFGLSVELIGAMPDVPREQAMALMEAAHGVCPYSNATRGNVEVKLAVA